MAIIREGGDKLDLHDASMVLENKLSNCSYKLYAACLMECRVILIGEYDNTEEAKEYVKEHLQNDEDYDDYFMVTPTGENIFI